MREDSVDLDEITLILSRYFFLVLGFGAFFCVGWCNEVNVKPTLLVKPNPLRPPKTLFHRCPDLRLRHWWIDTETRSDGQSLGKGLCHDNYGYYIGCQWLGDERRYLKHMDLSKLRVVLGYSVHVKNRDKMSVPLVTSLSYRTGQCVDLSSPRPVRSCS